MDTAVSLSITSAGLVTSVGYDARLACAAIRAGISRAGPLEDNKVLDLSSGESVPMTAHPITSVTDGFLGVARWLQMAPRAMANLIATGALPSADDQQFWGSCVVLVVVPDLESPRFEWDDRADLAAIPASFVEPLRAHMPAALPPLNFRLQPMDRTGLPTIVQRSREIMEGAKASRLVVLAVDSLLDPFTLQWLGETGRLKSDSNPVGLMPGECAAALLLETDRRGVHDDRKPWAKITHAATGREPPSEDDQAPRGKALAEVLVPVVNDDTIDIYVDLNGENWRAREYGTALTHLGPRTLRPHYAAAEVGDVGAASSVLNTVLAAHSLERGYALGAQVAVAISRRSGEVGALALRRA